MNIKRQSALPDSMFADLGPVTLAPVPDLLLFQLAAWPGALAAVAERAASLAGCAAAPAPGQAVTGAAAVLLRIAPLRWWLVGADAPALPVEQGVALDLSHAFTCIRLAGEASADVLNRHLSLDLRPAQFGPGRVATTNWHGSAVTVWRREDDWRLFIPRSSARDLVGMLVLSNGEWRQAADDR